MPGAERDGQSDLRGLNVECVAVAQQHAQLRNETISDKYAGQNLWLHLSR